MYEISTHIYHQNQPNVDRYTFRTMDPSWDISFSSLQICPQKHFRKKIKPQLKN